MDGSPQERSGCGPSCCGPAPLVSLALGYSTSDVEGAPDGANLGLGCGNPQAIAALKPGEVVLDLGSGGGFDCFLAAKQVGPSGHVIGVDMTPEMIARARANARRSNAANVEFRLGEIEHLPVADASVDVLISNCVINLSPDKPTVFREAFRVLRPGGRIAVSDVVATAPLPTAIAESLEAYGACIGGAAQVDDLQRLAASGRVRRHSHRRQRGKPHLHQGLGPWDGGGALRRVSGHRGGEADRFRLMTQSPWHDERGALMPEYLETTADKFTFRVAIGRLYSPEGVWVMWVQPETANRVRVGLTDFLQQHSGDVAFLPVKPAGTKLAAGDEFAEMETVKVNLSVHAPVGGTIVEVNAALELTPGGRQPGSLRRGWLAVIEPASWEADRAKLLDASAYLRVMQAQVEQEAQGAMTGDSDPGGGGPVQRHRQAVRQREPGGGLRAVRRAAARRDPAGGAVEAGAGRGARRASASAPARPSPSTAAS